MQLFVAKYGKSLKEIRFRLSHLSSDDLHNCLSLISRFESLESFGIEISNIENNVEPIDEWLKLLANKFTKLRELRFKTICPTVFFNNIFSLSEFRSLERLVFNSVYEKRLKGSIDCLNMTRLKNLSITSPQLTQHFFLNIHISVPNIQSLNINVRPNDNKSINRFVKSLQTLEYIERVVVNGQTFLFCKNRWKYQRRIILR